MLRFPPIGRPVAPGGPAVSPHVLKFQSIATSSCRAPLRRSANVGAMSRIQISSTGASITVTLEQAENFRRASRAAAPRGVSSRTGSYREMVCTTALSSCLTLCAVLPHSRWTAQAIQQQACGSHSAGIRIVIHSSFRKLLASPEFVSTRENSAKIILKTNKSRRSHRQVSAVHSGPRRPEGGPSMAGLRQAACRRSCRALEHRQNARLNRLRRSRGLSSH